MEIVVVQINNKSALGLLKNLEDLNVIKVLKPMPDFQSSVKKDVMNGKSERSARLSEIRAITKNISIDLTDFRFNRNEANNYD
jgi:hypothetical protein